MKANCISLDSGPQGAAPIQSLNTFCRGVGVNPITGWRWRKAGWLNTVNICGRVYVTQAAIENFLRRAEAGEFSREHTVPRHAPRRRAAAKA